MNAEQEARWRKALKSAADLKDGLGMPVDPEILETVAILRLMKVHTTMSCGGHEDRFTGGPYVVITSPDSLKFRDICRRISDRKKPEYKAASKKAVQLNIIERMPVWMLLDEFYENRNSANSQRIVMQTFASTRLFCQGADLAYTLNKRQRKELLLANRSEMAAFTEFMKDKFFESEGMFLPSQSRTAGARG